MSWEDSNKTIAFYRGIYKKGLMSAKQNIELYLYNTYIQGQCIVLRDDDTDNEYLKDFKVDIDKVILVEIIQYNGFESIRIVCKNMAVMGERADIILILPNLINCKEIVEQIIAIRDDVLNEIRKEHLRVEASKIEKEQREHLERQEQMNFFKSVYDFHITNTDRPTYVFKDENYQSAVLYIDSDKGLNFLVIDAISKSESNGIIAYDKIHYYEKAGTIHYASNIKASTTSFGGSFTGGTFSKKAAFWGGLLLGPMGMAGGTLFTHKPIEYKSPNYEYEIKSSLEKIDDRNVILNYFSDTHHQYIDIELPADIYNFLQTHIPDKKHDIALEIEKQAAIQRASNDIVSNKKDQLTSIQAINQIESNSMDSLEDFKIKVEKLSFMKDNGLLSQEEFEEEKKKLIAML